jgi:hypothetical protein
VFLRKAQTLHQCRVKEDEAWKKSQVDPVVKQLQAADKRQDNYMSCFHSIVNGYASLPEDEAQKAQAQSAKQVFKDFVFSINDSYGAEADKILQMGQNLQPLQEFLTGIGAWQWYIKAAQAATQVRYLLGERAKTKGETVKGEVKAARRQTDLAVADLYKTIRSALPLATNGTQERHDGLDAERRADGTLYAAERLRALRQAVLPLEGQGRGRAGTRSSARTGRYACAA